MDDKIEKNEMSCACSTCGGDEMCVQGFGEGSLSERDLLEDPGVDGRITLRWISRKWVVGACTGLI